MEVRLCKMRCHNKEEFMENSSLNISIKSKFLGKTSSTDKRTDFYGMMSEANHKIPNGYDFLHNPSSSRIEGMDLAYVNTGHIQHIFDDELFDFFKKESSEITLLLYNNTHIFVDFNIPDVSTKKCRSGVAITMSSMYVGKFEYGNDKIHFTGNHYDANATVGAIDDEISLVPFFFPYSIVYYKHDWKGNPDNSCIIKIKRQKSWLHFWGK